MKSSESLSKAGETNIALTGRMRAGKSLIASIIINEYGLNRHSFGRALKHYAGELFEGSEAYSSEYFETGPPCPFDGKRRQVERKPRKMYQDFGQAMRALDDNVWINHVEKAINLDRLFVGYKGAIIDDLRQPNEYAWARANGFTIIRVNAGEDTRIERIKSAGDSYSDEDFRHETESHVDSFEVDYEIWNGDGVSIDELEAKISEIMEAIR